MSEEINAATISRIAAEASVSGVQVMAVAKLLKDGNTVPFIARYRKEAHGNLDEVQILKIQERVGYYGELAGSFTSSGFPICISFSISFAI